jgi:hypothetical protein
LILRALNIAPLQHVVYKHFITQLQNKKMGVGVTAVASFILSYFEPHCKSHAPLQFEVLQHPQCLPNCTRRPTETSPREKAPLRSDAPATATAAYLRKTWLSTGSQSDSIAMALPFFLCKFVALSVKNRASSKY